MPLLRPVTLLFAEWLIRLLRRLCKYREPFWDMGGKLETEVRKKGDEGVEGWRRKRRKSRMIKGPQMEAGR